ncbi:MAG TPA: 1-acyl-sn-glycerol-3-phosphate acyltransferase [Candidatus Limnocylindria bacterium]|nr:1-acyl-sn-glycerol-3-phosphate acyltransferase [Candidatus Limnocylindria bacterium]
MPGSRRKPDVAERPRGLIGSPSPRPSVLYRLLRRLFRRLIWSLFRVEVSGLQHLPRADGRPAGGWIAVGLPHRTWVEFFIFVPLLPAEPRLIMLGDGPTMFGSAWRRALMRRVGGVVPVWRGSAGREFEAHGAAAKAAIRAGAVFGLFPEVGRVARPPALRRVSPSVAYFALRTGAPIVPFVFGGTHQLWLRRRIVVRVLPPLEPPAEPPPSAGSPAERAAADELLARLLAAVEPVAAEVHAAAEPPPGTRKPWRWLTGPYLQAD